MTNVISQDQPGLAAPRTERGALLAEVRGSVLRLLDALHIPPGRIRVSVQDVAVELEFPVPEAAVRPGTTAPAVPAPRAAPADHDPPAPAHHAVTSVTVGTFYRSPQPGAPPFVHIGDVVQAGQQLAIVEAMKLMLPVEADVSGRIREVLKDDGQPVEFGEALYLIERT